MKIKKLRFEYEAAGFFGSNKSHEALHTKNVIEASVLGPAGALRVFSRAAHDQGIAFPRQKRRERVPRSRP